MVILLLATVLTGLQNHGATARTSLGLGSIATQASSSVTITGGSITGITDLAVADGGTGQLQQLYLQQVVLHHLTLLVHG
jgi:hypothetical protein